MSKTRSRPRVLDAPRVPERADLVKRDILKGATAELAAQGYHGARIDQISEQTRATATQKPRLTAVGRRAASEGADTSSRRVGGEQR